LCGFNQKKICYIDDATFAGKANALLDLFEALIPGLLEDGIELNMSKCELISAHLEPEALARAKRLGIKVINPLHDIAKVLGGPISLNDALKTEWVTKRIMRTEAHLDVLKHDQFDPRLAFTLVKKVYATRALYLTQLLPPHITRPGLQQFDDLISSTVRSIFGQDITDYWLEHPGGLGIYRMEKIAQKIYDDAVGETQRSQRIPLADFVMASLGVPSSQHDVIKLNSQLGYNASEWITYNRYTHFSPSRFIEAIRLRANCHLTSASRCKNCGESLIENPTHSITCKRNTEFTAVHRHQECLDGLVQVARNFGITTQQEPTHYQCDDRRRQDITFCLGERSVVVDLTVIDPTVKSWATQSLAVPGSAATSAGDAKENKHAEDVARFSHHFAPLACELFGHMDTRVELTMRRIAAHLPFWQQAHFVRLSLLHLATAIQTGNAGIILSSKQQRARTLLL
jgi:hypothetical protein